MLHNSLPTCFSGLKNTRKCLLCYFGTDDNGPGRQTRALPLPRNTLPVLVWNFLTSLLCKELP